jgi:hypothetical protein
VLELFRSNSVFSLFGLILFTILIRMSSFFVLAPMEPIINTPFADIIFDWLKTNQLFKYQGQVIASLFIFLQAFLINYISSSHDILYKNSVMPGLFYILLNSIYPEQIQLSPQLLANTFLILLFNRLCFLYESPKPLFLVFDAGMLLGLGILLDYDLIIYLPFILISVLYMTSFNLRYWLVAIIGIIVPAYFLGVLFYITDHLKDFLVSFEYSFIKSYFNPIGISMEEGIIWFFIIPAFVFSLIHLQAKFLRNKVKSRRIQLIILVLLLFGIVSVFAENQGYVFGLTFMSISLCYLLANYFIRSQRRWLKELLFIGMLACIIYYQFFNS